MANLGIDAGATATKWSLVDSQVEVASGLLPAMDAHLYRESSVERFKENFAKLKEETSNHKIEQITLGVTGLSDVNIVSDQIKLHFNCKLNIFSDIELAYRVNFKREQGILLYAGTGSVALSIDQNNRVIKVGGWGYLLGDEGAGYWIGREAIRYALFALESGKDLKSGNLEKSVLSAIGARNWDGIKQFVYGNERSEISQLAALVSKLSDAGNPEAKEISENAGAHLADMVLRMDSVIGNSNSRIVFTGGVSNSRSITNYLEKEFENRFSISRENIAKLAAEISQ